MSGLAWLRPVVLVEKIGNGFFQLNDRRVRNATDDLCSWNDVTHPKTKTDVCCDAYRIRSCAVLFGPLPGQNVEGPRHLHALQLTYESVDEDHRVVVAPIQGHKPPHVTWTYVLDLKPTEHLVGMKWTDACFLFKTSHGRMVDMQSGNDVTGDRIWTLPPGFRIYGFHGDFCQHVLFLGPIFKAMELKQWDQSLYQALPKKFKKSFQMMLFVKERHKRTPSEPRAFNFWNIPEGIWDKIVHALLNQTYYDMDTATFFQDAAQV